MDDPPFAACDRGTKFLSSRVEALGHELRLLTELGLEPLEKRCLQVLSGHCTDTDQEAGELGAQLLTGCPRLPPLCTLASELLWEDGVVLEIGTLEIVLNKNILAPMSVVEDGTCGTVLTCVRFRQYDLQGGLDFLGLGALVVVYTAIRGLDGS